MKMIFKFFKAVKTVSVFFTETNCSHFHLCAAKNKNKRFSFLCVRQGNVLALNCLFLECD